MLDADFLKRSIVVCFFTFAISSFLSSVVIGYGWIILGINGLFFFWLMYLLCFNERFICFMYTIILGVMTFFMLFCCISIYFLFKEWFGQSSFLPAFASIGCISMFVLLLVFSNFSKIRADIFKFDGCKVNVIQNGDGSGSLGWALVISSLGAVLAKAISGVMSPKLVITVCGVFFIVFGLYLTNRLRNVMANLRVLRIKERVTGVPYVFMEIDNIREARKHWLIVRSLKWVCRGFV